MKITKILLILMCCILPLIHGKLLPTLGLNYSLSLAGNFEFTKAIFFNVMLALISLSCVYESLLLSKIQAVKHIPKKQYYRLGALLLIAIISTIFAISPFNSLIGDTQKGHTLLLFFNLLSLCFILSHMERSFLFTILKWMIVGGALAGILSVKELFFPTFDYRELAGRALGSFGHPNYIAGYLLVLFPYMCLFSHKYLRYFLYGVFTICIIATQSVLAIVLLMGYLCYICLSHNKVYLQKITGKYNAKFWYIVAGILSFIVLIGALLSLVFIFPEKLHSFVSRYYIWQTTLALVFSDWKILLFGGGLENLPYYFNNFKVPELYIFENFGFTADRPHNFFLNILFHFGLLGLGALVYFFSLFYISLYTREYPKDQGFIASLLLFLAFGLFHYFSIATYIIIVVSLAAMSHPSKSYAEHEKSYSFAPRKKYILLSLMTIVSLIGAYYSIQLYRAELEYEKGNISRAQEIFSHPDYLIELEKYSEAQLKAGIVSQAQAQKLIFAGGDRVRNCDYLVVEFPSAENYFYCGDIFQKLGKPDIAGRYYVIGLEKIPDLWNPDSPYWDKYLIKNSISGNRFFSEKFSNLREILNIVEK